MPRIFDRLTYKNKELCFVTDKNCPGLSAFPTGEQVAARGRQFVIDTARKGNFDYVFFLDIDAICDTDAIEKLISVGYPLAGGMHAARGDATTLIGHNYEPPESLERVGLSLNLQQRIYKVGGVSGGVLLVHRDIFSKVDYSGYVGPATIKGRFTADDEYLQIRIFSELGVRPRLFTLCQSWHLSDNGLAYQYFGFVSPYSRVGDEIIFRGESFVSHEDK